MFPHPLTPVDSAAALIARLRSLPLTDQISLRQLPKELGVFRALIVIITVVVWGMFGLASALGIHKENLWPIATRGTSFFDYVVFYGRFAHLHKGDFFATPGYPFTYFAPGVPLYKSLYIWGRTGGLVFYFLIVIAALVVDFVLMRRAMLRYRVQAAEVNTFLLLGILTSYPILFALERGNLEILLGIGVATGVWAYWRGNTFVAAILWGIFGSVKLYPLLLLAIFLSQRQFRQMAVGILSAIVTTVGCLLYIGPTIPSAFAGVHSGTSAFIQLYALRIQAEWWDHSIFMLLKLATLRFHPDLKILLAGYLLTFACLMLILYFVWIRKLPVANQLLILSAVSIALPPTSFDYTLVHLYAPWAVLVFVSLRAAREHRRMPGLLPCFILLAFLLTPTSFASFGQGSYAGQTKCLLLVALVIVAMRHPFDLTSDRTSTMRLTEA